MQFLERLRGATGENNPETSYNNQVGFLYQNPQLSAVALNDFKSRVFQPDCKFRVDWSINLNGKQKPMPPANMDLANIAYRSQLQCLAKGNSTCVNLLNDAKQRFMEPECGFTSQPLSSVAENVPQVFSR